MTNRQMEILFSIVIVMAVAVGAMTIPPQDDIIETTQSEETTNDTSEIYEESISDMKCFSKE